MPEVHGPRTYQQRQTIEIQSYRAALLELRELQNFTPLDDLTNDPDKNPESTRVLLHTVTRTNTPYLHAHQTSSSISASV
eukprot:COSAG01_NODE_9285_length_2495_cov_1.265860_2_plen_80_part_00